MAGSEFDLHEDNSSVDTHCLLAGEFVFFFFCSNLPADITGKGVWS